MKAALAGTAIALLAVAPAVWADCGDAHSAAMSASAAQSKTEPAQAASAQKAPARAVAKASATKTVKQAADKTAAAPKHDGSTVVAKSN